MAIRSTRQAAATATPAAPCPVLPVPPVGPVAPTPAQACNRVRFDALSMQSMQQQGPLRAKEFTQTWLACTALGCHGNIPYLYCPLSLGCQVFLQQRHNRQSETRTLVQVQTSRVHIIASHHEIGANNAYIPSSCTLGGLGLAQEDNWQGLSRPWDLWALSHPHPKSETLQVSAHQHPRLALLIPCLCSRSVLQHLPTCISR